MRELVFEPGLFEDGFFSEAFVEEADQAVLDRVKDAVEALDEPERAVVECIIWGQMSKTEVAEVVGRSRQSVHDLWTRAVDILREDLRDVL